jgi:hypothetical protein
MKLQPILWLFAFPGALGSSGKFCNSPERSVSIYNKVQQQDPIQLMKISDCKPIVSIIIPPDSIGIRLAVQMRNNGDTVMVVSKATLVDYVWGNIKSIGNYIIEIERKEASGYKLFPPSAHIDPQFDPTEEVINVEPGKILTDTISVSGYHFHKNSKGLRSKFPTAEYRVRAYFNPSKWGTINNCVSDWVQFRW